jgi:hypothetical protein
MIETENAIGGSLHRAGSDVRPVIRQSIGGCGVEVPHVFDIVVKNNLTLNVQSPDWWVVKSHNASN